MLSRLVVSLLCPNLVMYHSREAERYAQLGAMIAAGLRADVLSEGDGARYLNFALKEACSRIWPFLDIANCTLRTAVARHLLVDLVGHFLTLLSVLGNRNWSYLA